MNDVAVGDVDNGNNVDVLPSMRGIRSLRTCSCDTRAVRESVRIITGTSHEHKANCNSVLQQTCIRGYRRCSAQRICSDDREMLSHTLKI